PVSGRRHDRRRHAARGPPAGRELGQANGRRIPGGKGSLPAVAGQRPRSSDGRGDAAGRRTGEVAHRTPKTSSSATAGPRRAATGGAGVAAGETGGTASGVADGGA